MSAATLPHTAWGPTSTHAPSSQTPRGSLFRLDPVGGDTQGGGGAGASLVVLIPAYQPDDRLPALVSDLRGRCDGCEVLVVDDGSGPAFTAVFAAARTNGAEVVAHETNRGKGQALRTGFAVIEAAWPRAAVVTADADGQHTPEDVLRVAGRVRTTGHMTLGTRRFSGAVPLRSKVGNDVTALLFRGATGWRLSDTQTGLRGFPAGHLTWLSQVPGDRYEYELSVLLRAHEMGLAVEEVDIATIYEPGNTSSHFRPLQDSVRIYTPLLRFTGASLASFAIDWTGVMVIHALTGSLLGAVVGARLISGTANFFMNRRVFNARRGTVLRSAVRYLALAVSLLAASYLMLAALTGLGIHLGLAKILGDTVIYLASFTIQRRVVFRERETVPGAAAARSAPGAGLTGNPAVATGRRPTVPQPRDAAPTSV